MDRYQLRDALLAAGVSPDAFRLTGVHEPVPVPADFWFLRLRMGGPKGGQQWEIGSHERGTDEVRALLDSESAACAQLYRTLTGRPTPP
ncbi:hypothetical protein GCM10027280_16260 [Micromonospora polyrhachis]|uniref:Uncharacterized protein n=1 Tax=Micromonospora polyrhachis TaxID=1282883 RepID=A0A7W7WNS8_9ACTN|nr:hypothetical protein [Micromonospora polyrhachis]MBB4958486.1 hypothetical protein [Micromonospora polyrhachis]